MNVISNTDFYINVEGNSDLVNYKIQEGDVKNHYEVQFSIPSSVTEEFKDLKIMITNSLADTSETFYMSYFKGSKAAYSSGDVQTHTKPTTHQQEPYVPRNTSEDSQIITIIIVFLVAFGILIGLIYYCCSSVSTGYVNDSSFISSDSKDRRLSSTPKDRKNKSLRASHSKYHFRN